MSYKKSDAVLRTYQEGRVLAEVAIREDKKELGAVFSLSSGLKRVRDAGREVPQVTRPLRVLCEMERMNVERVRSPR